jgi:hypothetical protein
VEVVAQARHMSKEQDALSDGASFANDDEEGRRAFSVKFDDSGRSLVFNDEVKLSRSLPAVGVKKMLETFSSLLLMIMLRVSS